MSAAIHQNSSLSSAPPISAFDGLPPAQAQVVAALAAGKTVSAAARQAGVQRTTIHHWIRTLPEFTRAVRQAQGEYRDQLADGLSELAAAALSTLRALLDNPDTPASVRLKAALAILERPRFPQRGWSLPASVETPQQERLTEDMALLAADYKAMRMTEALQKADAVQAHVDAPPESNPAGPATPRNAPCPCGSRLKYKRCCGRNAAPVTNAGSA